MKFQKDVSLKNYTTFKIGGVAKYFFVAKTKLDLVEAVQEAKICKLPFFVLAGGSNLLISDKGYNGLVIQTSNQEFKAKNSIIVSDCGTALSQLVSSSLKNDLTGLEWAVGIPGTIGGAVAGNAGAFGGSIKDVVKTVEVFDAKDNKTKKLTNEDCKFGYRTSIFKETPDLIILSCEIQLKLGNSQNIKEKIQKYLTYRTERHPKQPSAGSVFSNINTKILKPDFLQKFPEIKEVVRKNVLPTAFLIDKCSLKGKTIGKAQVSKIHPNFIINLGGAKSEDVLGLISFIKKNVMKKFGIKLEEEIKLLEL